MPFDLPPTNGPARDACILAHIRSQDFGAPWCTVLATSPAGHQIAIECMADALTIGGVRINVSARLEQQIADLLGCLLMTPRVADLLYLTARARGPVLMPSPQPITDSTQSMIDHSARIDKALALIQLPPATDGGSPPVQTVGKHWVIDNSLLSHPGKAENYGWQFPGAQFGGSAWGAAVTPPLRCIQDPGWFHDMAHVDYSQICQLLHGRCTVDGQDFSTAQALQDPDLGQALSHNGPLRILRQPGVDVLAQISAPGATGGARAFFRKAAPVVAGAALGFAAGGPGGAVIGGAAGGGLSWGLDAIQKAQKGIT